ncbi:MAG: hypothetical protein ABIP63_03895 [Thermoanaerobaculia bacterium]
MASLILAGCGRVDGICQKRTMANLRTLGTLIESYHDELHSYPDPENLAKQLTPTYLHNQALLTDEWGRPIRYECWNEDPSTPGCDHYAVASAGADGKFSPGSLRAVQEKSFTDVNEDIVYRDGKFVQYPKGTYNQ